MEYFVQQLINGLTLGSIYGLIAIGYTMVFGIIGMVNFAHGDVFMVSTFVAVIVLLLLAAVLPAGAVGVIMALIAMLVASMVVTSLWNWAIEKVAYRPLRGSFRLAPLISAIGVSIFLLNFIQQVQGPRNKAVAPLIDGGFCIAGLSGANRRRMAIANHLACAVFVALFGWHSFAVIDSIRCRASPSPRCPSASLRFTGRCPWGLR